MAKQRHFNSLYCNVWEGRVYRSEVELFDMLVVWNMEGRLANDEMRHVSGWLPNTMKVGTVVT